MIIPLQITFKELPHSAAIEAAVRKKAEKLNRFSNHIIRCHVVIEALQHHHQHGNIFHINILITLPGKEIIVSRNPDQHQAHEDIYVAIRDAFNAAKRQVQDYVNEQQGKVKYHELRTDEQEKL
ncbi:MAG: RNA polymerase subunit sigma-54 [Deltaproteobacteria bacterium CG11_big_fil_rev_8_21_14_0_20_42_23]|nr:MAG: RNA polymerase subunit sigma-54 [Deltaproteobacteria bacterium CG11_big_fil_rev_8_21_14_0_20_42_23]PJC63422.1 MAG: RNA polymerase subunit sigma-54 [Deltaproteobacteria bacterium CG_4_9_14_0_2_um_filter_42_21]